MKAAELFPNQLGNAFIMCDAIDNSATEEDPTAGNMGAAFVEIEREEDEWEGWVDWEGQCGGVVGGDDNCGGGVDIFCSRQLITIVH